jgi:hypothetical protein
MTMYHHGNEAYEVAAARAGAKTREKMASIINQGLASAERVLRDVQHSAGIVDAIAPHTAMRFDVDAQTHRATIMVPGEELGMNALPLTDHAFGQLCTRAGIPTGFASKLLEHKSARMRDILPMYLETAAQTSAMDNDAGKSLLRVQDGEVRAVLSNSYKRRDSRPMLDGFMGACDARGMVPVFGSTTELKYHLRAVLPQVFEPVKDEPLLFGLEWSNSDWGGGAHTVKFFVMRMWCTNMAMGDSVLREVHLGKQLDRIEAWSPRTLQLESQTATSAMNDMIKSAMSPEKIGEYCNVVARANEEKVDTGAALKRFVKQHKLSSTEAESIEVITTTGKGVQEILPSVADTAWSFSNAVSFFAKGEKVKPTRRIELEQLAGEIIHV